MKTHDYTNEQLQNAIDAACRLSFTCKLSLCSWTKDWRDEKAQRLSIAKAFLLAISEPTQEERWQQEFSEWWTKTSHTDHNGLIADSAWQGFLAAKKGGAK